MDPPAYALSAPNPTSARRSIEDTRALILANAAIIKPRQRTDGPIELIIGKVRPADAGTSGTRSFTSSTSNVTIRVQDSRSEPSAAAEPAESAAVGNAGRPVGKHYAALVSKDLGVHHINIIILGEPQDTVEDALEWMLDRTEVVITEMLSRHRKQVGATCCNSCSRSLIGE